MIHWFIDNNHSLVITIVLQVPPLIFFPWTSPLRVLKEVRPLRVFKEARPDFVPFGTECGNLAIILLKHIACLV
jgi:hypothetical protein